eukprot:TRINITY_DN6574_c0_g1_i1.p1 TRINITY_DN6574_c0_g1~~TRINITY_DN6574_c0_g1_i1.p1  ORF type:complete len:629 (-),score=134.68 TRINITY_DN6574_c0_g1_i1:147-2033(-)
MKSATASTRPSTHEKMNSTAGSRFSGTSGSRIMEPQIRFTDVAKSITSVFDAGARLRQASSVGSLRNNRVSSTSHNPAGATFDFYDPNVLSYGDITNQQDEDMFAELRTMRRTPPSSPVHNSNRPSVCNSDTLSMQDGNSAHHRTQLEEETTDPRDHLKNLREEQHREKEMVKKMHAKLSDSVRMEVLARRRVEKNEEQVNMLRQRSSAMEEKMLLLTGQLEFEQSTDSFEPAPSEASTMRVSSFTTYGNYPERGTRSGFGALMTSTRDAKNVKMSPPTVKLRGTTSMISEPESPGGASRGARYSAAGDDASPVVDAALAAKRKLKEAEAAEKNALRDAIRRSLIEKAGSAWGAFRSIDLNGSGSISQQEFADGVQRLGVNWQDLTGFKKNPELFRLFDRNKDMVIDFKELFPDPVMRDEGLERLSTPELWEQYCRKSGTMERKLRRVASWQCSDVYQEAKLSKDQAIKVDESVASRKRMSAAIRRLKSKGESDARCRQIVARHLPIGTGPKDLEDVCTFSEHEVNACKKVYADQVNEPMRNITKVVFDMREQRKTLANARQKLAQFTVETVPLNSSGIPAEQKDMAAGFASFFKFNGEEFVVEDHVPETVAASFSSAGPGRVARQER